jgi:hypothetical protein
MPHWVGAVRVLIYRLCDSCERVQSTVRNPCRGRVPRKICDTAVTSRLPTVFRRHLKSAILNSKIGPSGARDLNPGPHGPELCDISFRNGGNHRFLFEFVARTHCGALIRPDLFAELLHELLQNWLALKRAPPLPPYRRRRAKVARASVSGVAAYLGFPEAANGFEDRDSGVRSCPSTSSRVRSLARKFHGRPPSYAVVRHVGCHLSCQPTQQPGDY